MRQPTAAARLQQLEITGLIEQVGVDGVRAADFREETHRRLESEDRAERQRVEFHQVVLLVDRAFVQPQVRVSRERRDVGAGLLLGLHVRDRDQCHRGD
jgi:uncharacterized protein involved in copper resistance